MDIEDVNRRGALSMRAENTALKRMLTEEQGKRRAAEKDAELLAKFVADSGTARLWPHQDVTALATLLIEKTLDKLESVSRTSSARGIPSSHVLYDRAIKDARAAMETALNDFLNGGLSNSKRVTEDMRADLWGRVKRAE